MAQITNRIENFKMHVNEDFVRRACELEPRLFHKEVLPQRLISFLGAPDYKPHSPESVESLSRMPLSKGDAVCIDFGTHHVGYISFTLSPVGSPPDAPAHIRVKLGEMPCEIMEDSASYQGSISSSWIQEEYLHIDELPAVISLPRRYAFRYLELKVMDTSPKYQLIISHVSCDAVTSGDMSQVAPLGPNVPRDLRTIDAIALKTMEDCMQSVFEDGPKRDRRLWIGDLRLQALTNYETFKNYDLVKRCLYLFAGLTQNDRHVGACLFIKPSLLVDDTALYDYGLFFISCLYDYYKASGDMDTLIRLWPTAFHQARLAVNRLDCRGVVKDSDDWWCFLDWQEGLNKQAGAQGVLIYTMKQALELARILRGASSGQTEEDGTDASDITGTPDASDVSGTPDASRCVRLLEGWIGTAVQGALKHLWDDEEGFFVSGSQRQISWASQIWLILASVLTPEENGRLLDRLIETDPPVGMVTPYMYHHFIDALIQNGKKDTALHYIRYYWGQMADEGADCFWELYDPKDRYASPYGSRIINSYCHAWSCTPSYFIRRYFSQES